jgi:hypothetical protein
VNRTVSIASVFAVGFLGEREIHKHPKTEDAERNKNSQYIYRALHKKLPPVLEPSAVAGCPRGEPATAAGSDRIPRTRLFIYSLCNQSIFVKERDL